MTQNVGSIDRLARLGLGLVLLFLAFFSGLPLFESTVATAIAAIAGVVMIVVAATRVCPVYSIFGIRTCRA